MNTKTPNGKPTKKLPGILKPQPAEDPAKVKVTKTAAPATSQTAGK